MRDIGGFAVAEATDFGPIIDAFARLSWPVSAGYVPTLASELGWVMTRDVAAKTTLPVTKPEAGFLVMDDELVELKLNVSDSLRYDVDVDEEGTRLVKESFGAVKAEVRKLLGDSVGARGGSFPKVWWDLASGGRVNVHRLNRSVLLDLGSKRKADLERDEARRGTSPDRVVR